MLNRPRPRSDRPSVGTTPSYGEAVPAVRRALAVLECLHAAPARFTLSQLSRELGISPSSLLAILRTLRHGEYVQHDEATGQYRLGPALAALAETPSGSADVWRAAEAVVHLAHATRVTEPSGTFASRQTREAQAALGHAAQHLAALLLFAEEEEITAPTEPEAVWRAGASGPLAATELDRFLGGDCLATLSCVKDDGYPYSVPVWYQWEDGQFWLVPRARAAWASHVQLNPRVSLSVSEHQPPLRRVLVEGQAAAVDGSGTVEHAGRLVALMAHRYLGPSAGSYLASELARPRQLFAVVPEKLVTWRGLAPHPRYQAANQQSRAGVARA